MAIREILTFPNPRLAIPSEPVAEHEFGANLESLVADMLETMYAAPGIGLAAPQIDVHKRLFVIDIDYEPDEEDPAILRNRNPRVFINPVIKDPKGEILYKEGCLSVPGIYEEVKRAEEILLEYRDAKGAHFSEPLTGLMAIAVQHENDHLLGRLFIDRLSFVKSRSIKKKIRKERGE